jgi:tetratricopeptide (TPR) repeat protein
MTATKGDIQRLIECCICCDYLTEVRETPCCHQLFCYSCIQSWLQKSTKSCPRCRSTALTEQSLLKNIVIQRFVENLQFECPNALQGCSVKMPKCDLIKHQRVCAYSPEKLSNKQKSKLEESRSLLSKCKEGKMHPSDNVLYDLAKLFHTEHEYDNAKECVQMIKDKNKSQELLILQAQIERDTNQYDKALELYTKAYSLANSISQRIELLSAKGHLLLKKAQYEQAKDTFTQALDLLYSGDESQTKAEILNALGLIAKKCSDVNKNLLYHFRLFLFL